MVLKFHSMFKDNEPAWKIAKHKATPCLDDHTCPRSTREDPSDYSSIRVVQKEVIKEVTEVIKSWTDVALGRNQVGL